MVIAGRSSDTSIFAAMPVMKGFNPATVWHMAKIMECGAASVVLRKYPDCNFAIVTDDHFIIEPPNPDYDSSSHWQNCMRGHAAANIMPLMASNRVGKETAPDGRSDVFYGRSFIADYQGEKIAEMDRTEEGVRVASFDMDAIRELRRSWGVFRDRRPELYGALMTLDGKTKSAAV